jgi:hypothetical protein
MNMSEKDISEFHRMKVVELREKLGCPTCKGENERNCILPCFHMFCRECLEKNIESRNRKCPFCRKNFDKKEIKNIPWCSSDM